MANQRNDTITLQNEISGVSTNMSKELENTEKKMTDMITLSSNNLRSIIRETARDFEAEIDKVNTKKIESANITSHMKSIENSSLHRRKAKRTKHQTKKVV